MASELIILNETCTPKFNVTRYIEIWIFVFDPIYPTPPLGQDMTQGQLFKRSLAGLNSEFFLLLVASPRLKNLVCPT